jgi:hypothetical protein
MLWPGLGGAVAPVGFPQDPGAHQQQVAADERGDRLARQRGQHVGADGAAQHARDRQVPDEGPIHVAETPVREAGDAGGEHLGRVDAGARGRGRKAEAEHDRGPGQAVGHANGTVDELGREADRDEENEVVPHWAAPFRPRPLAPCDGTGDQLACVRSLTLAPHAGHRSRVLPPIRSSGEDRLPCRKPARSSESREWLNRATFDGSHKFTSATLAGSLAMSGLDEHRGMAARKAIERGRLPLAPVKWKHRGGMIGRTPRTPGGRSPAAP